MKTLASISLLVSASLLPSCCTSTFGDQARSTSPGSLVLAAQGKTSFVIALAADAIPAERTAAVQLRSYFQQITGAWLPLKSEGEVPERSPQILIGAGRRARRLVDPADWKALGNDGILIQTQGNSLILAGRRPRGTLYAVYQFLEDSAGVRWWTPSESAVPQRRNWRFPAQDVVYTPPFAYRENYSTGVQADPLFAARLRENGHFQKQDATLGGHYNILGFCHTFEQLLPLDKYFKAHPEWYSDPANGNKPATADSPVPEKGTTQLNLTNDEMRRELTKNALAWIRADPGAGIISISQNDNDNYCRSEGDMALIEREGSPSGAVLHFVNAVAADIEKEYPYFLVDTLAYAYTQQPPRFEKPRRNVMIRLCPIGADFSKPFQDQGFGNDLEGWKAIAPRLYIWDYVTNFYSTIWPHANWRVLGPNLRYLARSNVYGVFEQGDAYTNGVGDFVQLREWLVGHLMWNPQQDENRLIDEFLAGYYGTAAPHLRRYIDLIPEAFAHSGQRLSTFQGQPERGNHDYFTLEVVDQAWSYFAAASASVAADPILSQRVRRERLALDNVIISRYPQLSQEASASGRASLAVPRDIKAFVNDFIATAKANGVGYYCETQPFSVYETQLRARYP